MADYPGTLAESRTGIQLRRWQDEASRAALQWWSDKAPPSALIQAVMGAGKTHLTGILTQSWNAILEPLEHVVIVVPTRNLVEQTAKSLRQHWCGPKVGQFFDRAKDIGPVIVTTYDSATTLVEQLRMMHRTVRFVIADECHQTENPRGHEALAAFQCPHVLGLSATPFRSKTTETLRLFERIIYKYGPADGLRDGIIVPFETVSATRDFTSDDVDDVCLDMIAGAVKYGPGVVNAPSIKDSEAFAKRLSDAGIPAAAAHSRLGGTVLDESTALGQRIRWLRMGKVQVLVYPTLLSEGVDLPWLAWLCARRKVASRVRFAQEVGRILRAHEGKRQAYLLDPHDLTGSLALDYAAAIGWQDLDPEKELHDALDAEDQDRIRELGEEFSTLEPAKKLDISLAFARRLANAWRQTGKLRQMRTATWRHMEPTPNHIAAVGRLFGDLRYPDDEFAPLFRASIESAGRGEFDRGTTNDLLEIMHIVDRSRAIWPMLQNG